MLLCRICIPTNASEATTPAAATLWRIVLLDMGNRNRREIIGLTSIRLQRAIGFQLHKGNVG
jgi:hypothetical protein